MLSRRSFLKTLGGSALLIGAGSFPLESLAARSEIVKLTILHTNDVHSRIEPFPMDGGPNEGLGGAARRAALIKKIRTEERNVLLLDAGDIFQGTPYFKVFGGELEFKLMSEMGYDATTIGNHDFDAGLDGLYKQLPVANFPIICCNYDFSDTLMHDQTIPYKVFEKEGVKIGVLGVGIELDGLVLKDLFGNTRYIDPLQQANHYASLLKNEEKCDFIICLSHLGYAYNDGQISDHTLAQQTEHIDLIIGGHTHTFVDQPTSLKNRSNKEVLITQVGWAGIVLGRLDVYFERSFKHRCITCKNQVIH